MKEVAVPAPLTAAVLAALTLVVRASAATASVSPVPAEAEATPPASAAPAGDAASREAAAWIATLPPSAEARLALAATKLEAGETETALKIYELVSGDGEYLEAETGQVRAALANGETRKAVAYGSRVADENRDSLLAQLLLVYLVDRTGKPEFALENLETMKAGTEREERLLATLRAELLIDRGRATEALAGLERLPAGTTDAGVRALRRRALRALGRPLPAVASGAPTPPATPAAWPGFYSVPLAGVAATGPAAGGVAIDAGRRVLTRLPVVPGTRVLVRNGLGLVRPGVVAGESATLPVTVVTLDEALPADMALGTGAVARAEGTRFCFTLGNRVADPEWRGVPAVYPGIVFRRLADGPYAAVTADTGGDLGGAPLFDAEGRLIGLGAGSGRDIGHAEAASVAIASESFAAALGLSLDLESADGPAAPGRPRPTVVELHERLAPATVSVFVAAPAHR